MKRRREPCSLKLNSIISYNPAGCFVVSSFFLFNKISCPKPNESGRENKIHITWKNTCKSERKEKNKNSLADWIAVFYANIIKIKLCVPPNKNRLHKNARSKDRWAWLYVQRSFIFSFRYNLYLMYLSIYSLHNSNSMHTQKIILVMRNSGKRIRVFYHFCNKFNFQMKSEVSEWYLHPLHRLLQIVYYTFDSCIYQYRWIWEERERERWNRTKFNNPPYIVR